MASPGELNRNDMVVGEEAKKKHKRRREKKKTNLINEEEEEDKQPESDAPNSEGEQKESIELKKKKKKMKKLEREEEDVDEEREEEERDEGSKSEEKKRKVKVNSGSGIMTTERFESLPISDLSLNSIKEMNFQSLTQVTDEEGRRRFHRAFTGGYSASYCNTVGSKEGWIPQTFTSSRKNRAEIKQQIILNFLDDDEKGEMEGRSFGTSMKFDTFGFKAAEIARKQAEKEQQQRPSIIPGPAPDELVLPATDSIGVKLLLKMGWRNGHAIKDSRTNSLYVGFRSGSLDGRFGPHL